MLFSSVQPGEIPNKIYGSDLSISFPIDIDLEGDILVWARHYKSQKERFSLFRFVFHTSFVNDTILRFEKEQIDGVNINDEVEDDFFIDMIFSPL